MSQTTIARPPALPASAPRRLAVRANLRQAYDLALMGAMGALVGLYLYVESVQAGSVYVRDLLAGLLIGGSLGMFLNAYGPLRDGSRRKLMRAIAIGAPAAAIGGAAGLVAGEVVIGLLKGGLMGRAMSWAVLGLGIGLGQGMADRSRDRLVLGLIGGGLGGFLGGFLFEWLRVALGERHDLGQAAGIVTMGAGLGLCLALVEQALRRSWVQVLNGRQEGRVYLLSHARSRLGLDERAEVGLFGDSSVVRQHAEIESTPEGFRLVNLATPAATRVN
ncbi:MAG: FHA domain-containing protein, partial [Isosphaeraceae bacterium]